MKRLNVFSTNNTDTSTAISSTHGHYVDMQFDLHASGGTNIFGYTCPFIKQAIDNNYASATSSFWKFKHPVWSELEHRLDRITNYQFESFIPSLTGSDGVDNALKIMWSYWRQKNEKRNVILVRKKSYHSGSIVGWQLVHGQDLTSHWPQVKFIEFFDDLEETINKVGADNIAGVLVDTVPWNSGLQSNSTQWWEDFQATIDKYNLLLCVDEVITGIGRMGYWLHSQHLNLHPNIVILGKALTAGHENLALTILDNRVTTGIEHEWLPIGNTRSVNTMGAVVACAVIDHIIEHNVFEYVRSIIFPYVQQIGTILKEHNFDVSIQGSMIRAYREDIKEVEKQINAQGLYHNWDNFWHLPFYDITEEEMSAVITGIKKALGDQHGLD